MFYPANNAGIAVLIGVYDSYWVSMGETELGPLLAIITAIVIAAVSSWITVNLSLRRYHSERWWDRKVEAYSAVIEALHHSKAFSDGHLASEMHERELSEDEDKELRSHAREGNIEIEKAIDVGSFLLSGEALIRLQEYRKEEIKTSELESWVEYLLADQKVTGKCLKDIIEIAKKDLKPEPAFIGWLIPRRRT